MGFFFPKKIRCNSEFRATLVLQNSIMYTAEQLAQLLELQPHPEGGYFKEVYRSQGVIPQQALPEVFQGDRNFATGIYFLLTSDTFSAFHKIHQDEAWHFYLGDPLCVHMISPDGDYEAVVVGNQIQNGQKLQFAVPGGYWFAAEVVQPGAFSLVGCTVAPGFDFQDFTMPSQSEMITLFPQHQSIIKKLTRV